MGRRKTARTVSKWGNGMAVAYSQQVDALQPLSRHDGDHLHLGDKSHLGLGQAWGQRERHGHFRVVAVLSSFFAR